MIGFTHFGFGLLIGISFSSKYAPILSGLGSVLPDVDSKNSMINKLIHSYSNNRYLKHRGIMHSLTVPLIIYLVYFAFLRNNLILPFIVGYISHLFLDMLTPLGVPLLAPFANKHFKISTGIKTATLWDYVLGTMFYLLFFLFEIF
jgi:membrane-bound metal-dependent hydrolase YbcI (DUF457 family)